MKFTGEKRATENLHKEAIMRRDYVKEKVLPGRQR